MPKAYTHDTDSDEDEAEANEGCVLSVYDGIGCLSQAIKGDFSSLGYTKYIALEQDYCLRLVAEGADPAITQIDGSIRIEQTPETPPS